MASSVGGKTGFGAIVATIVAAGLAAFFGGDGDSTKNQNAPDANATGNVAAVNNNENATPPVTNNDGTTPENARPMFETLPALIDGLRAAIGEDGLDDDALEWILAPDAGELDAVTADALVRSLVSLRDNERAPFDGPRPEPYATPVLPRLIISADDAGSLRVKIAD